MREDLKKKINTNKIEPSEVEEAWTKLKLNIKSATNEACGTRTIGMGINKKIPWFTSEVKLLSRLKKEAYLKFKSTKTLKDCIKYKETRNRTNT